MLKWLLRGGAIVVALFVIIGFFLPSEFEIVRSRVIEHSPLKIYPYIMNVKRWPEWWPWDELPKEQKFSFPDPSGHSGEGATIRWVGRPAPGSISLGPSAIWKVEFKLKFDANSTGDSGAFEFRQLSKAATEVTWRVKGHFEMPIISRGT